VVREAGGLAARCRCWRSRRSMRPESNYSNQVDPMGLDLWPHRDFRRGPRGRPGHRFFGGSPDSRCDFL